MVSKMAMATLQPSRRQDVLPHLLSSYCIKQGNTKPLAEKKKDTFLTVGFTNWKDAAGGKKGAFPTYKRSEVGIN